MASIFDSMPDYASFNQNFQNQTGLGTPQVSSSDFTRIPISGASSGANPLINYDSQNPMTFSTGAPSGGGSGGGSGGFFSNLWQGIVNGTESAGEGILKGLDWGVAKPIDSALTLGADFGNRISNAASQIGDDLGISQLPRDFNGNISYPNPNPSMSDVGNQLKQIWSTSGSSPDVASQAMGGGTQGKVGEFLGSMLFPGEVFSGPAKALGGFVKPIASDLNAAARGESGLNDAVSAAQEAAAQTAEGTFAQKAADLQNQEAVNSAQKGNLSLVDMMNRSPDAQQTFLNTTNEMAANQGNKGNVPSLAGMLGKIKEPDVVYPPFRTMPKLTDAQAADINARAGLNDGYALSPYQSNIVDAQNTLKDLNSQLGELEQARQNEIASQFNYLKQSAKAPLLEKGNVIKNPVTGDVISRYGNVSGRPQWYQDFKAQLGKNPGIRDMKSMAADHINNGFQSEFGQVPAWSAQHPEMDALQNVRNEISQSLEGKSLQEPPNFELKFPLAIYKAPPKGGLDNLKVFEGNKSFAKQLNQAMGANAESKPFDNPFAQALDKNAMEQLRNDTIQNAKGEAALGTMREFNENKNPLQSAYSKTQDSFNRLFNLSGALGNQMPHYYDYLSSKDYRTGQAAKDIIDTLGKHSPQDLQEFRLARDAGEIGPGHQYEALNNAYDSLLNKYTGADVSSGLERGHLQNYVPRMQDVDKVNMQSVKRALGSDSLGGFAEDRTDKRTLRQIISDEGRDPYKSDMYDITMGRLQKSINAQESRNFIDKMVNDGKAMKFENSNKAFSSPLYDKATTGVYVDPITKESYLMPKDTASFLNKEKDYSDLKQYFGGLDAVNSIVRRLGIVNPLVHFPHNILTSIPYALHEAGASGLNVLNPSWWKKGKNASHELLDEMERMGVLKPDYMPMGETAGKDLAHAAETQGMSPVQKWLSDMKYESKTGSPMERINDTVNTAFRPLDALTWKPEHAARVAVYQTARDMGATPEEAAAVINRNFGTNTKTLTPFEKNVMTRAFTFYPWLKHIVTWGSRALVQHPDLAGKTAIALNQTNSDLSGHSMFDNPEGNRLKLDLGYKDQKGNEVFADPYLPFLDFAKAADNPLSFLYNRASQSISTPINLLANKEYGPFSPSDKPIVDQGKVDAGLQSPLGARAGYIAQRLFSGPSQEVEALTGNTGNDLARSLLSTLGAHTSAYSESGANYGLKLRGENAAKAEASYDRQQGIPLSKRLKMQEQGRIPYPINP